MVQCVRRDWAFDTALAMYRLRIQKSPSKPSRAKMERISAASDAARPLQARRRPSRRERPESVYCDERPHGIIMRGARLCTAFFRPEEKHVASGEDNIVPPLAAGTRKDEANCSAADLPGESPVIVVHRIAAARTICRGRCSAAGIPNEPRRS